MVFILLGVLHTSRLYGLLLVNNSVKFSSVMSSVISPAPSFRSSVSEVPTRPVFSPSTLPHSSWMLCSAFFLLLSLSFFLTLQFGYFLWPCLQVHWFFPRLGQLYWWIHLFCYGGFRSSVFTWFFLRVSISLLKSVRSCNPPSFPLESLTYLSQLLIMSWQFQHLYYEWVWLFWWLCLESVLFFLAYFNSLITLVEIQTPFGGWQKLG